MFDRRFLNEVPLIYTRERFEAKEIKVYQWPTGLKKDYPFPLPEKYIGSLVTINDYGLVHSSYGNPAIVTPDEDLYWYNNGVLHNENAPAVIENRVFWDYRFKILRWYNNGILHRDDGPAVVRTNGSLEWYKDGKLHREDGPAYIGSEGVMIWFLDGVRARYRLPALIHNDGSVEYYDHGRLIGKRSIKK